MEKLTLYTSTYCPFCIKVKKVLEQMGIEGVEVVNIDEDTNARDELIEKGGKKQVPCLMIGDKALYESNDIIAFLQEKFA